MSSPTLGASTVKLDLKSAARQAVLRADPTEAPRLVLLAIDGPSQFVMGLVGPLSLLLTKGYFVTVTDRSVYIHRGPRTRNRPEELVAVIPRAEAGTLVARVKRGRTWNALYLRLAGDAKPTRLNVSFHSASELDDFLKKFPASAA